MDIFDLKGYLSNNPLLNEIKINSPKKFIKLNLPPNLKDNNDKFFTGEYQNYDFVDYEGFVRQFNDLVDNLIKLNPQIDSELFIKDENGIMQDIADMLYSGYPDGVNLYEFYKMYFNALWPNLVYNVDKYSEDELESRDNYYEDRRDEFADYAMKGQWLVVPGVTD